MDRAIDAWNTFYSWAGAQPLFAQVALGIILVVVGLPLAIILLALSVTVALYIAEFAIGIVLGIVKAPAHFFSEFLQGYKEGRNNDGNKKS